MYRETSPPDETPFGHSDRRTRPRLTEQIQVIRELWLLREQARVQAAERCFLAELERLLSGRSYSSAEQTTPSPPRPPSSDANVGVVSPSAPVPPPLPPFPPASSPTLSTVSFLDDGFVFESHPPPRGESAPARERPGSLSQEMEQARASQRVTVSDSNIHVLGLTLCDILSHILIIGHVQMFLSLLAAV